MTHTPRPDLRALEALVADNPELARLEALLDQFNIFEALGATRQELRHSDFLAYMLDPRRPHGLGDALVKQVLRQVIAAASDQQLPDGLADLELWDLGRATVRREWQYIDILLLDETRRLALVIENKVGSGEHSSQLQRYWELVRRSYPGWLIIGLYLTPDGARPSDGRFVALDYAAVCAAFETLLERRADTIGADVRLLISHYTQMLRRHIMGDSEIDRLCLQLYARHHHAIDLIKKRVDRRRKTRAGQLERMIRACAAPALRYDPGNAPQRYIRFLPQSWDVPALRAGAPKGWSREGRTLLLEFENEDHGLTLLLVIGPGDEAVRAALFAMALGRPDLFDPGAQALQSPHQRILQRRVLSAEQIGALSDADEAREIDLFWQTFLATDLPALEAALRSQAWIWQADPHRPPLLRQPQPAPPDDPSAEA